MSVNVSQSLIQYPSQYKIVICFVKSLWLGLQVTKDQGCVAANSTYDILLQLHHLRNSMSYRCGVQDLLHQLAGLKPKSSPIPSSGRPTESNASRTGRHSDNTTPEQEDAQRPLQQPWQSGTGSSTITSEIQPAEDQPDSAFTHQSPAHQANGMADQQQSQDHAGSTEASWFKTGHDWVSATSSQLAGKANALWQDEVSCTLLLVRLAM